MAKTVKVGKDGTPKTLSQIAKKQGVTLQALLAANPKIKDANLIKMNQSINIPDTKKMPGAKGGPYGRISQVEMNKLRRDGKEYATGIRAKIKAGAETSATPKEKAKLGDRLVGSSLSPEAKAKARKDTMPLPKSKPKKKPTPVSSKTGSSLSKTAMAKAKALKDAMPLPKSKPKKKDTSVSAAENKRLAAMRKRAKDKLLEKVKTAAKTSRRKGRKA